MSPDNNSLSISLVIPAKDESSSLSALVASVARQSLQPDEVIIVDGGSSDDTVEIARRLSKEYPKLRVIETPRAMPGEGRNIGIREARNEWIALTDAGITLTDDWLERLTAKVFEHPEADIVYGNYSPVTGSTFEKAAAITYVPAQLPGKIRGTTIASYLVRKEVWEKAGGFPDSRAAEDLAFMEAAERAGFTSVSAPEAMVYWKLCPSVFGTFRRFVLYSKHNVWAGRAWDWHYGVARQYLMLLPFVVLSVLHSWWWLSALPLWLGARTFKRSMPHRAEFGNSVFDPRIVLGVAGLTLVVDAATLVGWVKALVTKRTQEN